MSITAYLLLTQLIPGPPSRAVDSTTITAADWSAIRAARYHAVERSDGYEACNPAQSFVTRFDKRGFVVRCAAGEWTFGLALREIAPTRLVSQGSSVMLDRGPDVAEWWINDEQGLEHGLTLRERRAAPDAETTRLYFDVRGSLLALPSEDGRDVNFVDAAGTPTVSYSGLVVIDANDRKLPARFECAGSALCLVIDDQNARYPLTIDPIAQRTYFKASNTGVNDTFGTAVAISGNTVVIGAPGESSSATGVNGFENDDAEPNSGAAYVFAANGTIWTQQAYLKASAGDPGDAFGAAVAISRDTIVIGAPGESSQAVYVNGDELDNSAPQSGAAYIFERQSTIWSQTAYVKSSNAQAFDHFGTSVAGFNDTILIGAPDEDSAATGVNGDEGNNSAPDSGAVYVLRRNSSTWAEVAYLKASNTEVNDHFGGAVAVAASTAVVGAAGEDSSATGVNGVQADNSGTNSGAAYVFAGLTVNWTQEAYLKASNTDVSDAFGTAVAIAHVPQASEPPVDPGGPGGVDPNPGNPQPGQYGHPGSWAIAPDVVVVGAPNECSSSTGVNGNELDNGAPGSGAAYVFVRNVTTWHQRAYLKAAYAGAGDRFGAAVAISQVGDAIAIGAPDEDGGSHGLNGDVLDDSCADAGAVFAYARSSAGWTTTSYVKPSNTGAGDRFGSSVSMSLQTIVVGAPFEDSGARGLNGVQADESRADSGAAFRFDIAVHPEPSVFCTGDGSGSACPCGNVGAVGSGCANGALAGGARLASFGVAGIGAATDTLVLAASNVTGLAMFAQGAASNGWYGTSFGDGLLCLSTPLLFLGAVQPSSGSASIPSAASPAAIHVSGLVTQIGTIRGYQAFYRDASAFCTPSSFNTTTAVLVTWGQ